MNTTNVINPILKKAIQYAKSKSFNGKQATKTKVINYIVKADTSDISQYEKKGNAYDLIHQEVRNGFITMWSSDIENGKKSIVFYAYEIETNTSEEQKRIYKIFNPISKND